MNRYFVIILFFSITASAQWKEDSFYHSENLKLSNRSFNLYIKNHLRSIISVYYNAIRKINPTFSKYYIIRKKISQLYNKCNKIKNSSNDIYKELKNLHSIFNSTLYSHVNNIFKLKNETYIDISIEIIRKVNDLSMLNNSFININSFNLIFSNKKYCTEHPELEDHIYKLKTKVDLLIVEYLPKEIRNYFDSVLFNFIRPVELYILEDNNKEFLISRLKELNNNWNVFHQNISNDQRILPSEVVSSVKSAHNRWNSILKIIF